jgi:hypothetical protein
VLKVPRTNGEQTIEQAKVRLNRAAELGGMIAPRATVPPKLDGLLDEPIWHGLASAEDRWRIAYDDEFLYVAWSIQVPSGLPPNATVPAKRMRDAEVENSPRAVLELDLDGDFSTAYRWEITLRGETQDRCCGHRNWQPVWFVALQPPTDRWQAELAIRLSDLVDLTGVEAPALVSQRWNARLQQVEAGRFDAHPTGGWQPLYFALGEPPRAERAGGLTGAH